MGSVPRIAEPTRLIVREDGKRVGVEVGVIVSHPTRGLVLLHTHQRLADHIDLNTGQRCPAPLDLRMVALCGLNGIETVYVYSRHRAELSRIAMHDLEHAPILLTQERARVHGAPLLWVVLENVAEVRNGGKSFLLSNGAVVLSVPDRHELPTLDLTRSWELESEAGGPR